MTPHGRRCTAVLAPLALAGVLLCASCAPRLRPRVERPEPAGESGRPEAAVRYKGLVSFPEDSKPVRVDLFASAPDLLRMEVRTPLGQPLLSIASAGGRTVGLLPRERLYWEGPPGADLLEGLGPAGDVRVWVAALIHDSPSLASLLGPAQADPEGRVVFSSGGEQALLRVLYGATGAGPPEVLECSSPGYHLRLERVSELRAPDGEAYLLHPPAGFERIPLPRAADVLGPAPAE